MALVADRVLEGSTTTGTGNFTLTGAFAGHRSFNAAFASASSVLYCIEDGVNWEVGVGTFTAPSTLVRSTVQSSSNGGSLVDFPVGAKRVFNTYTASSLAPASGGASGLEMTVSTTTTDADPGTGVIRWNNSTQASATSLFIDNADSNSASLATLWASTQSGSFLKIINAADSDNWQQWKVTATPVNGTGYYKFTVSLQASSGSAFANGAAVLLDVDESGSGGSSSASGISITDAGSYFTGTDVEAALQELGAGWGGGGGVIGSNAFSVHAASVTTTFGSGYTKMSFDTKDFDTHNAFDLSTGKFQPTEPGYYLLTGTFTVYNPTNSGVAVYKNGALWKESSYEQGVSGYFRPALAAIVYLNGSTDYAEMFGVGGSGTVSGTGATDVYFQGALLSTTGSGVPRIALSGDGSTSTTVSSTTFVDITGFPAQDASASVGDTLEIEFSAGVYLTSLVGTASSLFIGFDVNGTFVPAAAVTMNVVGQEYNISARAQRVVQAGDLVSGVVPIKPRWKIDSNAAAIDNSSSIRPLFTVKNFGDGSGVPAKAGVRYASYTSLLSGSDFTTTSTSFVDVPSYAVSITAAVGDKLKITLRCCASGRPQIAFATNGTDIPGLFNFDHGSGTYPTIVHVVERIVQSGDLVSGAVPIKARWKSATGGICYFVDSGSLGGTMFVENYGQ